MRRIHILLILSILLVMIASGTAFAELSGSQTVTMELDPHYGPITIYTTVLDYGINDNWFLALVLDTHPIYGLEGDLSSTIYFRPLGKILYTSIGVRKGLWQSQRDWTPYLSVTYRF